MPGLAHYMAQYDHEHQSVWNKVLHAVGIPIIFLGLGLLATMHWKWGGISFVGGWLLLFLGHKIEGNHPAFFQGAVYLLVGPVWVAKEIWSGISGTHGTQTEQGAAAKKS